MSTNTPTDFRELGIAPGILQALDQHKITEPTPIQHQAIPIALDGKDVIGIAQTGTGKTFAFGLPMLQRLSASGGRGLVVVPTRELAYQVEESLKPFANSVGIKMAVVVGGSPMGQQCRMFKQNPRIIIATPGRLNDHLEQKTITLKDVNTLVLDEADRMLDMGFKPQINKIMKHVPEHRHTMLFSATMAKEIFELATKEMKLPLRIEVAPSGTTAEKVEQELIVVRQENKAVLLKSLLKEIQGSVLVFTRTKHGAKRTTRNLNNADIRAAEIHANRSLSQRREALAGFKSGKYRVLIATDIAARGIDVTDIAVVINHDLPDDPADYVHRIGRTGRAGRSGHAISFATPIQAKDVQNIERLTRAPIKRRSHPAAPDAELQQVVHGGGRGRGGNRRPSYRSNNRPSGPPKRRGGRGGRRNSRP